MHPVTYPYTQARLAILMKNGKDTVWVELQLLVIILVSVMKESSIMAPLLLEERVGMMVQFSTNEILS